MNRNSNRFVLPSASSFFGRHNDSVGCDGLPREPSSSGDGPDQPFQSFFPPPPPGEGDQDSSTVSSASPRFHLSRSSSLRNMKANIFPWKNESRRSASPRSVGLKKTNSGSLRNKQRVDNVDIHHRPHRQHQHQQDHPNHEKQPKYGLKQPPSYSIQTATPVAVSVGVPHHGDGAPKSQLRPHTDPPPVEASVMSLTAVSPASASWKESGPGRRSPGAFRFPPPHDKDVPCVTTSTKKMMPPTSGPSGNNEITHPSRGFVKHPQVLQSAMSFSPSSTHPHQGGGYYQHRSGDSRPEKPLRHNLSMRPPSHPHQGHGDFYHDQQHNYRQLMSPPSHPAPSHPHQGQGGFYNDQQQQYRQLQQQQQQLGARQAQQMETERQEQQRRDYLSRHPHMMQPPRAGSHGFLPSPSSHPPPPSAAALSPTVAVLPAPAWAASQPSPPSSSHATPCRRLTASSVPTGPPNRGRAPVYVEIYPGVMQLLRGADETARAADVSFVVPVRCNACTVDMLCIADAAYAICPLCRVVSPAAGQSLNDRWGVGLGFVPPEDDPDLATDFNQSCVF
jgi:hypothetical protein